LITSLLAVGLVLAGTVLLLGALSSPEGDRGATDTDPMIGQMILMGFAGDNARDPGVAAVHAQLAKGVIGGVVLYPENIRSTEQLKSLTAYLRDARASPVPFIAVDQEGGVVQRLTSLTGHTDFPSAESVGANPSYSTPEAALKLYTGLAGELAAAGFNLNFGPVVDLNLNPHNPVIGARRRSFGDDPETVTALARAFIEAHRDANIVTTPKHFPGHGSSRVDSHHVLADVSETWREVELEPYRNLAKDGMLDAVMTGHVYHPRFSDGAKLPASLSAKAIDALRSEDGIDFQGVVISDDLEMGAVSEDFSLEDRLIKAINAGTDIVIVSNVDSRDPELGAKVHAIIAAAVADGRISRTRIEQAYGRIMQLRRRLAEKNLASR
jgi:beta-N-acetylhexosaminidase